MSTELTVPGSSSILIKKIRPSFCISESRIFWIHLLFYQPFTPPRVIPFTKFFWMNG